MIELIEVTTLEQKSLVKNIIENNHSYVPTNSSVGRRIDWLIFEHKENPIKKIIPIKVISEKIGKIEGVEVYGKSEISSI
jgi:hypothetical protein